MPRLALSLSVLAIAVGSLVAGPALAQRVASGSAGGLTWEAQSRIVGVTPTAGATGGDPLYFPSFPQYSGVVGIRMDYTGVGSFVCSGTLLNDRRTILTAAHCVSDGFGTAGPNQTTVFFQPEAGLDPNASIYASTGVAVEYVVSGITVHPGYTGEVIDQNDIALLDLGALAPLWAKSYGIYNADPDKQVFNVAGYGRRSTIGGNFGSDAGTGRLRQGDNRYDFRLGDDLFNDFWTERDANGENFFGFADIEYSYLSDFDNGLAANDKSCRIAAAIAATDAATFCDLGLGAREVGVAGGDSGGPNFIGDLISGVNSYGLSFGTAFGDIRAGLNNSFGEFSGYVPTWIHYDWIRANSAIPLPSSLALGLLAVAGAALVTRRRRQARQPA
jgi:hypothetical protein